MRLSQPRVAPLTDSELDDEQRELLAPFGGRVLNIFRTMARAPKALKRFNLWGGYILSDRNSLAPRERELLILRTGWLCRSGYEWVQHTRIGLQSGLTQQEIDRIKRGPDAPGWSRADSALLRIADDLVRDFFVSDATWAGLGELRERQRMDAVFTVGQYTQVSMFLNSFGVQLDEGQMLDPDFPR
ncbi:MAG: carboxymuconolactone decarboxylase family protein [Sphingomonas sp.]|uniref:carboxymuconolactone decarboxylase family protein n=1 Tax=Sphingomonas sp. TaxID=28214 RepID=UPI003F7DF45E